MFQLKTDVLFPSLVIVFLSLFLFFQVFPVFARTTVSRSGCVILVSVHKRAPAPVRKHRSAAVISPRKVSAASTLTVVSSRHKHPPRGKKYQSASIRNKRSSVVNLGRRYQDKQRSSRSSTFFSRSLRRKLSSKSAIVVDAETGNVIYAHSPDRPRQPASTIKVLTGLISLESLEKSDSVSVSRRAAGMPRSKIYLHRDRSYPADDLINAVLLGSANDASVALAEKIGGTETRFAGLMTRKAQQMGARYTVCKTATGLTARGQKSTVRDLAIIFNKAMENPAFAGRMARTKVRTREGRTIWTHNKALWKVAGAKGGKTGYTRAARQTYVGMFSRGQDELIVAIMGSETMWDDINNLVEYSFKKKKRARTKTASVKSAASRVAVLEQLSKNQGLRVLSDRKKGANL
ncbi:MAG: serine hydrolase [Thermodesulfobacteriota bacterium]|nr:serine hydrolase [Thermodesulfobacteriota bacterium]